MDDTLYPEFDYMVSGFREAMSAIGHDALASEFEVALLRRFGAGQRKQLVQDVLAELGVSVDERLVAEFLAAYRNHTPTLSLTSTVRDGLDRLKSESIKMVLVTDGEPGRQSMKVQALGLEKWFDQILLTGNLGDDIDKSKPQPFEWICSRFHPDSRFLFVADNSKKDFIHPLRLGWSSIQIRRTNGVYSAPSIEGVTVVLDEEQMFNEIFHLTGIDT